MIQIELAKTIRAGREAAGLTQKEFSTQSGVALTTIQDIESGEGNPTVITLEAMAQTLKACLQIIFIPRSGRQNGSIKPPVNVDELASIRHRLKALEETRVTWIQSALVTAFDRAPAVVQLAVRALLFEDQVELREFREFDRDELAVLLNKLAPLTKLK